MNLGKFALSPAEKQPDVVPVLVSPVVNRPVVFTGFLSLCVPVDQCH